MPGNGKFRGIVPPMITPLTPDGGLDESAVCRVIDHMIAGGVDGVVILGTTGECASVPPRMRTRFVELAAAHIERRVPLYVGNGDNCLARSVEMAEESFRLGADAVVAHLPAYYSLTPDEILDYFTLLADGVNGPLLLYNIPSTTHLSVPVDVVVRLSDHPRVAGFKDSENALDRVEALTRRLRGKEGFSLFVGATALSARGLALGMDGIVPSSANLLPRGWHDLLAAAAGGDWQEVEKLQVSYDRLAQILQTGRTLGQSLAALKAAMSSFGLCGPAMLPPLRAAAPAEVDSLGRQVAEIGFEQPGRTP